MIKRPIFALISIVLLIVLLGYIGERIYFLINAETTTGITTSITNTNSRCGTKYKRHSCTKYRANINFLASNNIKYNFNIDAGSIRGHNQGIEFSDLQINDKIEVIYDPTKPTKAYQNNLWGVWGVPIMIFIFQITTLISSMFEGRKRE